MVLFLTSDIGAIKQKNGVSVASKLNNTNSFVDELQKYITKGDHFLFVASSPSSHKINDFYGQLTFDAFKLSGFDFKNLHILDSRNQHNAKNLVKKADIVFLAGGDTISEMRFFNKINLSNLLKCYSQIIVGQSAGAMNLAEEVYCPPESKDEVKNMRYFCGLGLTKINIEPHYKNTSHLGQTGILQKILLEDSKKKPFIAITDGSYIVDTGLEQKVFGEAYIFKNGNYNQICKNGKYLKLGPNIFNNSNEL